MSNILAKIEETGFFESNCIDNVTLAELTKLVKAKKIQSLEDAGIVFMNESYYYIKYGNPDGVHVHAISAFRHVLRKKSCG